MALDPVPWYVGGGAEHSPAVARQLAYAATNGATGIILPGDLKVEALPAPSGAVRLRAGSAAIVSSYPGAVAESYIARNIGSTDYPVAATGSASGAIRHICLRVDDPQFAGVAAPANVANGPYLKVVEYSNILPTNVPLIWLATITQPPNTTAITQAMITDRRVMANARGTAAVEIGYPTREVTNVNYSGMWWPDFRPSVWVPPWATHYNVVATLSSIGHRDGNTSGILAVTLGDGSVVRGANVGFDLDQPATGNVGERHTLVIAGTGALPANYRGTYQTFGLESKLDAGSQGHLVTVDGTTVIYQINFYEQAS